MRARPDRLVAGFHRALRVARARPDPAKAAPGHFHVGVQTSRGGVVAFGAYEIALLQPGLGAVDEGAGVGRLEDDGTVEILHRGIVVAHPQSRRAAVVDGLCERRIDADGHVEVSVGATVVGLRRVGDAAIIVGDGQGLRSATAGRDEGRAGLDPSIGRRGGVAELDVPELTFRLLRRRGGGQQQDHNWRRPEDLQHPRQMPRARSALRCRGGATAGPAFRFMTASLPSSIRVANLTVPSSEISMWGVVPRIPNVATGVSTFMLPVLATLPATKVKVPLVKLIRVELSLPSGS